MRIQLEKTSEVQSNNEKHRETIITTSILEDLIYLSYRHRFALISALRDALNRPDFDFSKEFESDYDEYIT